MRSLLPAMIVATTAFCGSAHAETSASGSVSINGQSFEIVDAVAYPRSNELSIALSSAAFDREKMAKDGKVDHFDIMFHKAPVVTLRMADGKPSHCFNYAYKNGDSQKSGSSCVEGLIEGTSITTFTDARIAGKVDWKDEDGKRIAVEFDVPVEATQAR